VSRLVVLCFAALAFCAFGAQEETELDKRVMKLANELRCLVCQNQTIADSNAELALDLRNTIRQQLAKGASEQEVLDFMTARYGDFVLYRPPLKATTVLLWSGPFLLLVLGLFFLLKKIRNRRPEAPQLSEEERARAEELLK
jgi:cytochrome c-type biogenesis protein CcmH